MNEAEKREFLSQLVDNVQIYEERKENGQWLKSIEFKLPITEKEFTLSLDNNVQKEYFGRTIVENITGLKPSGASKLIKLLLDSEVIISVTGHGKGNVGK